MKRLLLYGANGYTGTLAAEMAKARGLAPILAGRSADKLRPLGERLGLEVRAFPLDRPDLRDVGLVLHCAGPFSETSKPMADACLAAGAHYLDVTGEVDVFEALLARDAEAKARGVVLLPGVGFDVVPSDCLARRLADELPGATTLDLAFAPGGRPSPGTLKTAVENLPHGGRVRRAGKLVRVPAGQLVREVRFADKRRLAMAIPWGDLATAYRSTGIPDITVYLAAKPSAIRAAQLSRLVAPLLGLGPVQRFLKARVEANVRGPDEEQRRGQVVQLWGRVGDGERSVEATLEVPEGYGFTAHTAIECAVRVLAGGVGPGAWTPSLAFGAGFVETLPGARLQAPAHARAPREEAA